MLGGRDDDGAAAWAKLGMPLALARRVAAKPREFDVFPENEQPLKLFCAMSTQWRTGANGATGLDYTALPVVEKRVGVTEPDSADCFWALGVMEREALAVFRERREAAK